MTLPMLPTHVIGSHGFPGWFWTALDRIKAGDYGQTDVKETFDDATQLAVRDQERAGVDIVCARCNPSSRAPVPQSRMMTVPSEARTSTQDVLPP